MISSCDLVFTGFSGLWSSILLCVFVTSESGCGLRGCMLGPLPETFVFQGRQVCGMAHVPLHVMPARTVFLYACAAVCSATYVWIAPLSITRCLCCPMLCQGLAIILEPEAAALHALAHQVRPGCFQLYLSLCQAHIIAKSAFASQFYASCWLQLHKVQPCW